MNLIRLLLFQRELSDLGPQCLQYGHKVHKGEQATVVVKSRIKASLSFCMLQNMLSSRAIFKSLHTD